MEDKPTDDKNPGKLGWPKDMANPIASSMTDGITFGIMNFIKKNNINTEPGTGSETPAKDFVLLLSSEFNGSDRPYPFSKSFKDNWARVVSEVSPIATAMWARNQKVEAEQLTRTIAYMETIRFLEEIRIEAVSEFNKIRGEDKVDFTQPPHG